MRARVLLLKLLSFVALEPTIAQEAPLRVGSEIEEPRKVKHVDPKDADRAGLAGKVVPDCEIDVKGRVQDVRVRRGLPPLTDAAVKAVRKWRYEPALLDGSCLVGWAVVNTAESELSVAFRHFRLSRPGSEQADVEETSSLGTPHRSRQREWWRNGDTSVVHKLVGEPESRMPARRVFESPYRVPAHAETRLMRSTISLASGSPTNLFPRATA